MDFRDAQITARDAWQALQQEHVTQPASDITSVTDALTRGNVAAAGIAGTQASINQCTQWMERPPVPADPASGVQKIRPEWLPEERLDQWRRAGFTGPQGIGAAASNGGIAGFRTFHRAVGADIELWLLFDVNNVLQHVSTMPGISHDASLPILRHEGIKRLTSLHSG